MIVCGFERVARRQGLGASDELLEELVVDLALDDDLAGVQADLALVEERPEGRHPHGVVDVDVVEDDHRVVAAELEHRALEGPAGPFGEHAGGVDPADEVDDPDLVAGEELVGDRRRPRPERAGRR